LGPFDTTPAQMSLDNPAPVVNGNFGQHLSVGDGNGDGIDDLYVSAIGNTAAGIPLAGQVYYYPGPVSDVVYQVIEDHTPDPNDLPSPRYGMTIDARGDLLGVGANRKDVFGVQDSGQGFIYQGPGLALVSTHTHPNPQPLDFMAFRVVFANVVGDASPDATFVAMPNRNLPDPNPYALFVWDGDALTGAPRTIRVIEGSGDHWGNGISYAQVIPHGYEELIVGDGTFDAPDGPNNDETGRVVIYSNL
jgi:hypothetical protein